MYSYMIVDDEKAIRESISKVIDFEKYGFSLCATARDGKEAMGKTKKLRPDLVLLDIRMPKLDGLGYLKELKEHELEDTKVLILSGFSDFTYAKTALKYGARGYLTKPLDEDEMIDLLKEIKEELDKKNQDSRKDYMHTLSENLMKMYHSGNGDRTNYKDFCFLHFVVLKIEPQIDAYSRIYTSLCDIFNEEVELFLDKGSIYSFLSAKTMVTVQCCINETAISHVINRISGQGVECAVIVDSDLFEETGNTFRSDFDKHLYTMLTDIYWNVKKNIIVYSKGRAEMVTDSWPSINAYVMNLKKAVSEENEREASIYLDAIFQESEMRHIDFTSIVDINYRVFYALRELVMEDEDAIDILQVVRWQDNPHFMTHKEMEENFRYHVIELIDYIEMKKRTQNLGVGEKAAEYIKKNFTKQILLKDVADVLYVNSAYLGRCIQKETGLSFNCLLANLRIEKAKELLRNTDLMIYEIAEAVGYTESKHFVTKFTSMEGCAPLSYRKKFREV